MVVVASRAVILNHGTKDISRGMDADADPFSGTVFMNRSYIRGTFLVRTDPNKELPDPNKELPATESP